MKRNFIYYLIIYILIISVVISFFSNNLLRNFNSIIWSLVTVLMFVSGIYFSMKYRFIQLNVYKIVRALRNNKCSKHAITSFESLSITLAAKIGVGSLSGIALAIYMGGPGTIFWMWICTIITSINTYVESNLGREYQKIESDGILGGGPSTYIYNGLHNRKLAILFSLIMLITYSGIILTIQANTIVKSVNSVLNINNMIVIAIVVVIVGLVIFNNIKKIAKITSKIVPIMLLIYIFIGLYIILSNINIVPMIIKNIFISAFSIKSFGLGFINTMIIGIQRGIFASESGIGTSAISASSTEGNKEKQGLIQVFGVYFTSLIICTITALIILTSKYTSNTYTGINGIEIVLYAFKYHLGIIGNWALVIIVILFAFSTIISGYFYGEMQLKFLTNKIKNYNIFKIIILIVITFGSLIKATTIWNYVDILIALLAIINITSILKLKK